MFVCLFVCLFICLFACLFCKITAFNAYILSQCEYCWTCWLSIRNKIFLFEYHDTHISIFSCLLTHEQAITFFLTDAQNSTCFPAKHVVLWRALNWKKVARRHQTLLWKWRYPIGGNCRTSSKKQGPIVTESSWEVISGTNLWNKALSQKSRQIVIHNIDYYLMHSNASMVQEGKNNVLSV